MEAYHLVEAYQALRVAAFPVQELAHPLEAWGHHPWLAGEAYHRLLVDHLVEAFLVVASFLEVHQADL